MTLGCNIYKIDAEQNKCLVSHEFCFYPIVEHKLVITCLLKSHNLFCAFGNHTRVREFGCWTLAWIIDNFLLTLLINKDREMITGASGALVKDMKKEII